MSTVLVGGTRECKQVLEGRRRMAPLERFSGCPGMFPCLGDFAPVH